MSNRTGSLFTNEYLFETLTVPGVVLALPVAISVSVAGFNVSALLGTSVVGLQLFIFPLWLGAFSIRERGTAKQDRIYGGVLPTTQMLRTRDSGTEFSRTSRRQLVTQLSGVTLLTARQERSRPDEADERIGEAVDILKEQMRDTEKFHLLWRELKTYGFWRNTCGIKPVGIFASTVAILVSAGTWVALPATNAAGRTAAAGSLAIAGLLMVFWVVIVRDSKLTDAAVRYAHQFLKSLSIVTQAQQIKKTRLNK